MTAIGQDTLGTRDTLDVAGKRAKLAQHRAIAQIEQDMIGRAGPSQLILRGLWRERTETMQARPLRHHGEGSGQRPMADDQHGRSIALFPFSRCACWLCDHTREWHPTADKHSHCPRALFVPYALTMFHFEPYLFHFGWYLACTSGWPRQAHTDSANLNPFRLHLTHSLFACSWCADPRRPVDTKP